MFKNICLLILVLSTIISAQKLSLEECLNTGLKNNTEIKIAQSEYNKTKEDVDIATSYMLPSLGLSASYTRLSEVPDFEVVTPFSPVPLKLQESLQNNISAKVSFQQPLFTGFRLYSQKKAAGFLSESSLKMLEKSKNDVALTIHQAFWNFFKARTVDSLIGQNITSLKKHLADTKKYLKAGLVTKSDVLNIEVELANLMLKQIETSNNIKLARIALNKAIGVELTAETDISTASLGVPDLSESINNYTNLAVKDRKEIAAGSLALNASESGIDAAKASWFPSLYLFGNYYYASPNQRYMPVVDEYNDSWDIGVSLQWDIFNWGRRTSQINKAREEYHIAKNRLELTTQNIIQQVSAYFYNYQASFEKVKVSKLALESSSENYRIIERKYNQQLASSTELLDAETSLYNARLNLTTSLVDYEISRIMLNHSAGKNIYQEAN